MLQRYSMVADLPKGGVPVVSAITTEYGPWVKFADVETLERELRAAQDRAAEMEARAISLFAFVPGDTKCGDIQDLRLKYREWRASVEGKKPHGPYRVELDGSRPCAHCMQGMMWTIVSGRGADEVGIGTSWGDEELANDICELMNMAHDAAMEAKSGDPA